MEQGQAFKEIWGRHELCRIRRIHRGDANFAFGYTLAKCSNDQFVRTQSQLTEKDKEDWEMETKSI